MNRYRKPMQRCWLPDEPRMTADEDPLAYSRRIVALVEQRKRRRLRAEQAA